MGNTSSSGSGSTPGQQKIAGDVFRSFLDKLKHTPTPAPSSSNRRPLKREAPERAQEQAQET